MDTTPTQPHRNCNTHRTKNNTTNVVIQPNSRKLLMMDILMSETFWAHKKWNKIASDLNLFFYSSTITMMHGPINIRWISSVLVCYSCVEKNEMGNMETFPSVPAECCWNKKWAVKMWCHILVLMRGSNDSTLCVATCHNSLNRSSTSHGVVCWIQEGFGPADGCWITGRVGVTHWCWLAVFSVGY